MKVVNTGLNHCAGKVINIFLKSQAIVHCKMKMHFTTSASCISQYYSDPNLNSAFSKTKFEQFLNTIFYKNQLSLSKLVKIAKFTFSDFTICQIQNLHNFGSQNFTYVKNEKVCSPNLIKSVFSFYRDCLYQGHCNVMCGCSNFQDMIKNLPNQYRDFSTCSEESERREEPESHIILVICND